jgi:hypothetical protein
MVQTNPHRGLEERGNVHTRMSCILQSALLAKRMAHDALGA